MLIGVDNMGKYFLCLAGGGGWKLQKAKRVPAKLLSTDRERSRVKHGLRGSVPALQGAKSDEYLRLLAVYGSRY